MKYTYTLLTFIFMLTSCDGLKKTFGSSSYDKSYDEVLTAYVAKESTHDVQLLGQKYNYNFVNAKDVKDIFDNQIFLNLNVSNLKLKLSIKEYNSSDVTLDIYAHFTVSDLNAEQIQWLEAHHYTLTLRVNVDANKTEPKPESVPTYVIFMAHKGQRVEQYSNSLAKALASIIYLRVSEYIAP